MMRRLVVIALVGLGILGAAVFFGGRTGARQATVVAEPGVIKKKLLCRSVIVPADGIAQVGVRIDGQVVRVLARVGDSVRAGQILAEIDAGEVRAEVGLRTAEKKAARYLAHGVAQGGRREERDIARAEYDAAKLELERETRRQQRAAQLQASGVATPDEVENAERSLAAARVRLSTAADRMRLLAGGRRADVQVARSRVEAADAAIRMATERLRHAQITAPVRGVIIEQKIDPGDLVDRGRIAFEIADPSRIEARLEAADYNLASLRVGQPVELLREGKVVAHGQLGRVAAQLSRRSIGGDGGELPGDILVGTAWVTLSGPPSEPLLLGTRLEAAVSLPPITVKARVPRGAVKVEEGQPIVFVPRGPFPKKLPVSIGAADDEFVEILGLEADTHLLRDPE